MSGDEQAEIARVEAVLRKAIARRKAAGVRVRSGAWGYVFDGQIREVCAMCAALPDDDAIRVIDMDDSEECDAVVAAALGIAPDDVMAIRVGFDGGVGADDHDPAFYDLGARLRTEESE